MPSIQEFLIIGLLYSCSVLSGFSLSSVFWRNNVYAVSVILLWILGQGQLHIVLWISMDFQRFYIMNFSTMNFQGFYQLCFAVRKSRRHVSIIMAPSEDIYGSSAEMSQSWVYHSASQLVFPSVTHILIGINPHSYPFCVHPPLIEISRTKFL